MEYDNASTVDAGEPLPGDPSTDEQTSISLDRLEALGDSLSSKRDEWVSAKQASGVEKRWIDDHDQYMGRDDASRQVSSMMDSAAAGFPVSNKGAVGQRSTVFINVTRPKTNTAEARVANMLLPTDDRNFGLHPSPSPELSQATKAVMLKASQQVAATQAAQAGQAGQAPDPSAPQAAPAPVAAPSPAIGPLGAPEPSPEDILEEADTCSLAMQTEIDNQLQDCNWNGECRSMIHDAAVYGTGILKGPIVVSRTSKTWTPVSDGTTTVHVLEIDKKIVPESYKISPWNVYPDPSCGPNVRNGGGIFECYSYTSKQVRELVKQPGFLEGQISKVLAEGPITDSLKTELEKRETNQKKSYKVWEYWGEFEPEDLRSAGVDIEDSATGLISGCVILINNTVIKGFLNPLDTGEIPYDFFCWEIDEESPWGYGVPHLCRSAQRVLNAAWRQLMDNSGNTMGPQIVVKPGIISPVDGVWTITGNKLWNCLSDDVDVRTAFMSIDIANHAAELENIIKMAKEFADEESMVPQLQQGEHGNAPDTVGGMTILVNSNNVVLGRIVKQFDDRIINPHVGRYVDWNMAYSDKPELKGDHHVQARGTSALLVRDIQNQTLVQFGQFQGSGVISPMVNWEAWIKAVLKAQHVDPQEILKTDAEIKQLQSQPPQASDAQIRAQSSVQVATIRAQGVEQAAATRAQAETHVADVKQQAEGAYAASEQQMAHDNNVAKLQLLQLQRDLAMLNYAQQHSLSLQQIQADLSKTQMQETTKRQLAAAEMQMKTNEGHANRLHDAISTQQEQPIQ